MTGVKTKFSYKALITAIVVIICIITTIPFAWMIVTSFKERSEIFTYPPKWIPDKPTLKGYTDLWEQATFGNASFITFTRNSIVVSFTTAALTVILASLAAFSLSRFRFRGSTFLKYTILLSQMLPGALLLIPLYLMMKNIRLLNTNWSLILAYTSFTLPYCTYILKSYFDTIPIDLDEAALIDGCSRIQALFRVVFPLAGPGIAVTVTQAFIMSWNEFMFALTFTNSFDKWTLPLALGSFRGQYLVDWGYLFAGSVLVTIPVVLLFLVLQKWFVSGFMAGAIKQ